MPRLPKKKTERRRKLSPEAEENEARRQKFYNSSRWRVTRMNQIYRSPHCEAHDIANTYDRESARHVDHIIPWDTRGGAQLDERNFMTLCRTCHGVKTSLEQSGVIVVVSQGEYGELTPAEGEKKRILDILASYL